MSSLTQRAAHATWWSALEITSRYGVQFAVMVVLARLLTPSDFGLIAMLLVFTTVAALLVDSGFGTALVQKQVTSDDDETTVFLFSTVASATVAAALWFSAPAIAAFYSQPLLTPLTRLLLFVLPLSAMASVPDALLTQRLDFKSRAKAEIVASLCSGGLAILLAWRGFGVWSLAWQAVCAIGIRALLLWSFSRWRPRGRFNRHALESLGGFGGYMLLSNLLNMISLRLQSLLIGKLFDSRALGYYTLAQNTQMAPAQFMSGVLNRVGLPVFSSVAEQHEKLVGALRLSLRVAIFVFVPCMIGIAVVAEPLIEMLYGPRWTPAAPLLSVLAVSAALWPLHVLNLAAIGAKGRSDIIFRLEVIKRIVSIGLIIGCSPGGPMAIAWAVLASSLFGVVINTWYSKKLLGYGVLAQLRDQASTLAITALAALSGWLVLHWMPTGTLAMVIAIFAAAAVYLCAAALSRNTAFTEILELARTLRSKAQVSRHLPSEP
ncbi:MAG TPA: lipopolysaccharide biosynthesis protein [Rhodanobacteraceae bacterium]|nr:lipopolysaccharide biosynthesis protein [Rhodanobacteraceae bacterium]